MTDIKMSPYLTPTRALTTRNWKNANTTKLTKTSHIEDGEANWLFFAVPIFVTLTIFILVISWIWFKLLGNESWKDIMNCSNQHEEKHIEKTESINNANYGEFIKHDVNSPIRSPPDNETKPALPLTRRTRTSCPAMSPFAVQKESAIYVENSLIDQQQYYGNIDCSTVDGSIKNSRPFRSENDLESVNISTGSNLERFKLMLEHIKEPPDLPKDKFASYVILEGNEHKIPSTVPKYEAPKINAPDILVSGSFIEINLSDFQIAKPSLTSLQQQKLINNSTEVPKINSKDCVQCPLHEELTKPSTILPELNTCNGEPFQLHRTHEMHMNPFRQNYLPETYTSNSDHIPVDVNDYERLCVGDKHAYVDARSMFQSKVRQHNYEHLALDETEPNQDSLHNGNDILKKVA